MRRKSLIASVVIALVVLAIMTMPVLAAWVGSLRAETRVQEPISLEGLSEEVPSQIFPGETFSFGGKVYNDASVPYGLRYYGYLWWTWEKTGEEVEISLETLENGEAIIETKGGPLPLGKITIMIGGEHYYPWTVINIDPGGVHEVEVFVTLSSDLEPGTLVAEVSVVRGAPITYLS